MHSTWNTFNLRKGSPGLCCRESADDLICSDIRCRPVTSPASLFPTVLWHSWGCWFLDHIPKCNRIHIKAFSDDLIMRK
uniref:Uncharacterized protein n=1 Tax=Anguilla anguilla TaxID=7936 RepID=A0A0E9Q850_ANGAN